MPPQSMVTLPPVKKDVPKTAIAEKKTWHPRHQMKVWTTRYGGASYRVIQLPRCEHLETVITYTPNGETFQQAKTRIGGIAVMSGSFHHPQSFSLADLLQREGTIANPAMTKRYFLVISAQGIPSISGDYAQYLRKPGVSMIALGQRLLPLEQDGFSLRFMNQVTERVALGMNKNYLFVVQAKTTIWRLASFLRQRLPCTTAINSDGGHVVQGLAPVHIVFRWRKNTPQNFSSK